MVHMYPWAEIVLWRIGYSGSVLSMIPLMDVVFCTRLFPALEVSFIHPRFDIGRYNIWSNLVLGLCNEECFGFVG
jgi:hypothetical protein